MLFGRKIPKNLLKLNFKKAFEGVTTSIFIYLFILAKFHTPKNKKNSNPHKLP